jgi:PadR family transcriptional regulator PadR
MSVNKELVKGSTSMLVLGVLEEKEMYGYQIIKELEQRSETVFALKEGTLYPILHVLEQDGFLEAYWEDTSYRITKKGRKELDRQKEEWKEYAGAVGKVLQLQNA